MNQIASIINSVLEKHDGSCLDNEDERNVVASAIASKLIMLKIIKKTS